jgi:hypothetical protein
MDKRDTSMWTTVERVWTTLLTCPLAGDVVETGGAQKG